MICGVNINIYHYYLKIQNLPLGFFSQYQSIDYFFFLNSFNKNKHSCLFGSLIFFFSFFKIKIRWTFFVLNSLNGIRSRGFRHYNCRSYIYMDSTHDGLGGVLEDLFVTFVRAAGQVVGIVHEVAGQHQFTVHALTDGVLLPCCVYNTKEKWMINNLCILIMQLHMHFYLIWNLIFFLNQKYNPIFFK